MLRNAALILTVGLLLGLTTYRQAIPSLYVGGQVADGATDISDRAAPDRVGDAYGKLPLSFEVNHGQADARVNFLARGPGYTLLLTPVEAVFALRSSPAPAAGPGVDRARSVAEAPTSSVLRMQLLGANPGPEVAGLEQLPGVANYLMGDDPARWRTEIPTYARVAYEDVYPGVNLVYYGAQRQLEYDFVVAPGGDPAAIRLGFRGADTVEVDARGDLVLQTPDGQLRQRKPVAYQVVDGVRWEIGVRHVLLSFGAEAGGDEVEEVRQVGFEVDAHDPARPLVIDPVLVYSTYLGGSGIEFGTDIAVDGSGAAYVTGETRSADFPTAGAFQPASGGGGSDAFVTKLSPAGTGLVYSTYLGGGDSDVGLGIAVDATGAAYVTGSTSSTNFPTANALQPTNGGLSDAFVAKLDATGSALVYSTYFGGSNNDRGDGIAVDSAGNAYVAGDTASANFPTANPLQAALGGGPFDAFVAKLNPTGSTLVYSTYLGGSDIEFGADIAVDGAGAAYLTGLTQSTDFPTVNAFQEANGGDDDTFVAKLDPAGSALVYSNYLGGSGRDAGTAIAVDGTGAAYLTGLTQSTNFPTLNPFQPTRRGLLDAYVAKLNPAGSALVYSSYLGGNFQTVGHAIAVDGTGAAYLTGYTSFGDFPLVNPLQASYGGGNSDVFVAKLDATGSALVYSTYLGGNGDNEEGRGIAVNSAGAAYVVGSTGSTNFPTANPWQAAKAGEIDAFVAKIDPASPATPTPTATATATPSPTPTETPTPTSTPTATSTSTPTSTATATSTPQPSATVAPGSPADLAPTALTAPATATIGQAVSVSYTVINRGSRAVSPTWTDTLYLSADARLDREDDVLGSRIQRGALAPGRDYSESLSVGPIPNRPPGSYFLILRTDSGSEVTEADEANNDRAAPITLVGGGP